MAIRPFSHNETPQEEEREREREREYEREREGNIFQLERRRMVKTNRQRYTYEGEMQCEKESKAE